MADTWSPPGIDIQALQKESEELARRLKVINDILSALGAMGIGGAAKKAPQSQAPKTQAPKTAVRKERKKENRFAQIAVLLKEAGRPLLSKEIAQGLHDRFGVRLWKSAGSVLRSMLLRQEDEPEQIVRTEPGYYTLQSMIDSGVVKATPTKEGEAESAPEE